MRDGWLTFRRDCSISVFFVVFFLLFASALDLKNGLKAIYNFAGSAEDSSGNGLNGIIHKTGNVSIYGEDRYGNIDSSLRLNSSEDYVEVSNVLGHFSFDSMFSLVGWVRPTSALYPSVCYVFHKSTENFNGRVNYALSYYGDLHDDPSLRRRFLFNVQSENETVTLRTNSTFPPNEWYQVVAIFNVSSNISSMKIYVSGKLENDTSVSYVQPAIGSAPLRIGNKLNSTDGCSGGDQLDDLRLYNRALTEEEVVVLTQPLFCSNFSSNSNLCGKNGLCIYRDNLYETYCDCDEGFLGSYCNIHSCSRTTCSNRGNCTGTNETIICDCDPNYFGEFCEVTSCNGVLSNDSSVCSHNGVCYAFNNCSFCSQKINEYLDFYDNFENSTFTSENWVSGYRTSACTSYDGLYAFYVNSPDELCPRQAQTREFSMEYYHAVTVSFRLRTNVGSCEKADHNENITVYIDNENLVSGSTELIQPTNSQPTWDPLYTATSPEIRGKFSIRFIELKCSGYGYDEYVLDDVRITFGEPPCHGNGTCSTNKTCSCFAGFSGDECLECSRDCGDHGHCTFEPDLDNICVCDTNYTGPNCEYNISCPHLNYCNGHGSCNDYSCNCDVGWDVYDSCNESYVCFGFSNLDQDVCSNSSGICSNNNTCSCNDGHEGIECEWYIECPEQNYCSERGKCSSEIYPKKCVCDYRYFGDDCSVTTCDGVFSNVTNTSEVCGTGRCEWYDLCIYCDRKNISVNFYDNFSDYTFTTQNWKDINSYAYITDDCGTYDGSSYSLKIDSPNQLCPRRAETRDFEINPPVLLDLKYRMRSGSGCETADSGDEVYVYVDVDAPPYSILVSEPPYNTYNFNTVFESSLYISSGTKVSFKWYQPFCYSSPGFDEYVLADVKITLLNQYYCNGNGSCVGDRCNCDDTFDGDFCLDCGVDCGNNGICSYEILNEHEWGCFCTNQSYTGPRCQFLLNCSHLDFCSGHGTCDDYVCDCDLGWDVNGHCNESFICDGIKNNDTLNVCKGRGICVAEDQCKCTNKTFTGNACQYFSVCMEYQNCSDVGYCLADEYPTRCVCNDHYYGEICNVTECSGTFSNDTKSVCGGTGVLCWPYNNCQYCGDDDRIYITEFFDDFEDGNFTELNWLQYGDYAKIEDGCTAYSGTNALRIHSPTNSCPRWASTRYFSVQSITTVYISFRILSGQGVCGQASSSEKIDVYLDTSIEGIKHVYSVPYYQTNWNPLYSLEYGPIQSDFSVRFYQGRCSSSSGDEYVLDDVRIWFNTSAQCNGNGTCVQNNPEYCSCDSRFSGGDCLSCGTNCGNHGNCVFEPGTFINDCICDEKWYGSICQSQPCNNDELKECSDHGTCVVVSEFDGIVSGECKCDEPWTGKACSVNAGVVAGVAAGVGSVLFVTILIICIVVAVLVCCCVVITLLVIVFATIITIIIYEVHTKNKKKGQTGNDDDKENSDDDDNNNNNNEEEEEGEDRELEDFPNDDVSNTSLDFVNMNNNNEFVNPGDLPVRIDGFEIPNDNTHDSEEQEESGDDNNNNNNLGLSYRGNQQQQQQQFGYRNQQLGNQMSLPPNMVNLETIVEGTNNEMFNGNNTQFMKSVVKINDSEEEEEEVNQDDVMWNTSVVDQDEESGAVEYESTDEDD